MVISPRFKDVDIYPLANNRGNEADHDETDKIQSVQMQEPFAATADYAHKPKGNKGENDIPGSAMNPSVKHSMERTGLHSVEIRLGNFPEEIQEEGQKTDADFRDSKT